MQTNQIWISHYIGYAIPIQYIWPQTIPQKTVQGFKPVEILNFNKQSIPE